jgi:hypothetical protein
MPSIGHTAQTHQSRTAVDSGHGTEAQSASSKSTERPAGGCKYRRFPQLKGIWSQWTSDNLGSRSDPGLIEVSGVAVHGGELRQGSLRDGATREVAECTKPEELRDDHWCGLALAQDPGRAVSSDVRGLFERRTLGLGEHDVASIADLLSR